MATNVALRIDPELVAEAQRLGLDVEREIALALRRRIGEATRQKNWASDNRAAIDEANRELEKNGLWYERLPRL